MSPGSGPVAGVSGDRPGDPGHESPSWWPLAGVAAAQMAGMRRWAEQGVGGRPPSIRRTIRRPAECTRRGPWRMAERSASGRASRQVLSNRAAGATARAAASRRASGLAGAVRRPGSRRCCGGQPPDAVGATVASLTCQKAAVLERDRPSRGGVSQRVVTVLLGLPHLADKDGDLVGAGGPDDELVTTEAAELSPSVVSRATTESAGPAWW